MKKILNIFIIAFLAGVFICPLKAEIADNSKEAVILQSDLPSRQEQSKYKLSKPVSTSRNEFEDFVQEAEGAQDYIQIINSVNSLMAPFLNLTNYERR